MYVSDLTKIINSTKVYKILLIPIKIFTRIAEQAKILTTFRTS